MCYFLKSSNEILLVSENYQHILKFPLEVMMMKDHRKNTVNIVSNEAVRGKPYLDIDRVITESKTEQAQEKYKTT
ncbi:hypothetical protein ACIFOT_18625 [Neobacillus sp. NRS-1170]|uniref:hypothetical protein n=1 Tax=Neobacillus sp. NRS-1170 TaxID=3233898 RepID=UPI003D2B7789